MSSSPPTSDGPRAWRPKPTVRARLIASHAGIAVLLLIPLAYGLDRLTELREIALEQRGEHAAAFVALGRLETTVSDLERYTRSYVAAPSPDLRQGVDSSVIAARLRLDQLVESGYGEFTGTVGAQLDSIEHAVLQVTQLVETGRVDEATEQLEGVVTLLRNARASLEGIARAIDRRSYERAVEAQDIGEAAVRTTFIAALIALLLALVWGGWTTGALTAPLHRLRRATARVAEGHFETPPDLPYRRGDEIGDLSRSFRAMAERLAELERLRAEFVSVVTHDLKTPVNVIGGYAALIEEGVYGDPGEQVIEVIRSIRAQTGSLNRLVEQLLDMGRLEAGGFPLQLAAVDTARFFDEISRTFGVLAERAGIQLRVVVEPSMPRTIHIDEDRLRDQVLGNLLSNALKFTPSGGRILVRGWRDDGRIHIEVADTGAGIPPDRLRHVFEKFYQLTGEARAKGTGLGLAIARDIVEAHGGTITVESEPGRGSRFHVLLPHAASAQAAH